MEEKGRQRTPRKSYTLRNEVKGALNCHGSQVLSSAAPRTPSRGSATSTLLKVLLAPLAVFG